MKLPKIHRMTPKTFLIITAVLLTSSLLVGIGLRYKIASEQQELLNTTQSTTVIKTTPIEIPYMIVDTESLRVERKAKAEYDEWFANLEFAPIDNVEVCENGLYDVSNVGLISGLSVEEWSEHLKGTGIEGYAQELFYIENLYGVNGFFAIATSVNEVGWIPRPTNRIYWEKNNAFNIKAYNKNPYKNAKQFDTVGESVIYFGGMIRYNYLNEDGDYHNGLSVKAINSRYAKLDSGGVNHQWGFTIKNVMGNLASN